MSESKTDKGTVLECEVPSYRGFLLLATQSKLSIDWFDDERKKSLKKYLDGFHANIEKYNEFTPKNSKDNASSIKDEVKTLCANVDKLIKEIKTKNPKTDKEKKFITLVDDQISEGAKSFSDKIGLLLKSKFTNSENLAKTDDKKNNNEALKTIGNPFLNYIEKRKKFEFAPRDMTTDEHAVAYLVSFVKTIKQLTERVEQLNKEQVGGYKVSNEEVITKTTLIDKSYETFRSHVTSNTKGFPKASTALATLKTAVENYKKLWRSLPIKDS